MRVRQMLMQVSARSFTILVASFAIIAYHLMLIQTNLTKSLNSSLATQPRSFEIISKSLSEKYKDASERARTNCR